jgi:peptide/nickel transport system permease protein
MTTQTDAQPLLVVPRAHRPAAQPLRWAGRFARRQPLGAFGAVVIAALLVAAVFTPYLRTSDPQAFGNAILERPSGDHWFGTNRKGQDMWSRVLYATRPALAVGVATVTFGVVGGTLLALVAGYFGGRIDMLISRLADIMIAFPGILFGLVMATALGAGLRSVVIAISIVVAPIIMRVIRAGVLGESQRPYVEAARVIGATGPRVMFRHILPNVLPLVLVIATATLPAAILLESSLTFLGAGLPLGEPSWGNDLNFQARALFTTAPWLAIFPGIALSLTVLAFNLLGDALRDILDPRLRGSGIQ